MNQSPKIKKPDKNIDVVQWNPFHTATIGPEKFDGMADRMAGLFIVRLTSLNFKNTEETTLLQSQRNDVLQTIVTKKEYLYYFSRFFVTCTLFECTFVLSGRINGVNL